MDNDFLDKLREKQLKQRQKAEQDRKELDNKAFHASTQNRVIEAIGKNTNKSLKHEPKVEIKNADLAKSQDISTLGQKLEEIKSTLSGDTKWQEVSKALEGSFKQLESLLTDKDHEEVEEQTDRFIQATKELSGAIETIKNITIQTDGKVEQSVSKLVDKLDKTNFTPKVDTKVEVEAPDLSGIEKEIAKLDKSIKGIKLEEKESDYSELVKELQKLQSEVAKVYNRPIPVPEYPTQISVTNPDGTEIGGSSTTYELRNDTTTDTNLVYLGKALPGSDVTDAAWQIKRYNKSTGHMSFADDVTTFTKQWSGRTTYGY